jgi:hypothetical protein
MYRFRKPLTECGEKACKSIGRTAVEEADRRYHPLLCTRGGSEPDVSGQILMSVITSEADICR